MLRKKYPIGIARSATKQGDKIAEKYKNFVGENLFERLSDPSKDVGDKIMSTMFAGFSEGTRIANKQFLLANLTPDEFKSGVISPDRLAAIRDEMGRFRVVEGAESIIGNTAEVKTFSQYKKWAFPILTTITTNLKTVAKDISTKGTTEALKSRETAELLTASLLAGTIVLAVGSQYKDLEEKGSKRTLMEDLAFRATRDSLSMIGVLDPNFIAGMSSPRLATFVQDLAESLTQTVKLEEYSKSGQGYEKGDLKGIQGFQKAITPKFVKQFQEKESGSKSKGDGGISIPEITIPEITIPEITIPEI
jgi:hypothetical protein